MTPPREPHSLLPPDRADPNAWITVRGAAEHNLKHVDLDLPKHRLIVFTGVSGSGKSSMAFDTLYAEGQRRYIESLSAYARQFLGQMDKPKYDSIRGLSPTISIEQRTGAGNPRSTVGTITEIYDYLRVLFARVGTTHCWQCGRVTEKNDPQEIVRSVDALGDGARVVLMAPIARNKKGTFAEELLALRTQGYQRIRIDGTTSLLEEVPKEGLDKNKRHMIDVVVDRLVVKAGGTPRLTDSIETALKLGEGRLVVEVVRATGTEERLYSESRHCPYCDVSLPEPVPALFSFNSPIGACPHCGGLGSAREVALDVIVPDGAKSIRGGAIAPWTDEAAAPDAGWAGAMLDALAARYGFSLDTPWESLTAEQQQHVLHGSNGEALEVTVPTKRGPTVLPMPFEGVVSLLRRKFREARGEAQVEALGQYFVDMPCAECKGARLRREARSTRVGERSIPELVRTPIGALREWSQSLTLDGNAAFIARDLLREIRARLGFLTNVGLDYLTLERASGTLSGGEAQRIRLASQVGSELTGVLYVLDEPSIGLHARDNQRLIETLTRLRDIGNTVLVVEHDSETMLAADHLVDFGLGAGRLGGAVIAQGTPAEVVATPGSLTADYLSGRRRIERPGPARSLASTRLVIRGARAHNLKGLDVAIPLGRLTVVTGVSGAGKSSLINGILLPALSRKLHGARVLPGEHDRIEGLEHLDKVVSIDQKPIGRTPRSNPATYTKTFDLIRSVFAETREARAYGYGPGRFSFNVKGGRCEACEGAGVITVEMHFLSDVYVTCEACQGRRFNDATLRVHYREKNIFEVLQMPVAEAQEVFSAHRGVNHLLKTLIDVGLEYISLGQPATTLSGGEAQRIKLSRELARLGTGRTIYLLDEPSTGLHFEDIRKLLGVLHRLVEAGNTVVMIEHNLDIIRTADHLIDIGPDGGGRGGELVAAGTPDAVARVERSHTGRYLRGAP